jgi:hypothetical protein
MTFYRLFFTEGLELMSSPFKLGLKLDRFQTKARKARATLRMDVLFRRTRPVFKSEPHQRPHARMKPQNIKWP